MKINYNVLIFLVTISLFVGISGTCLAQGLTVGQVFKGGQLSDVNGNPYSLKPVIGAKPMVIWICDMGPVAEGGVDNIKALYESFSERKTAFFIISTVGAKKTSAFIRDNRLGMPVLMGGTDSVTRELSGESGAGISPVDNLFIIDRKGILRYKGHLPGVTTKTLEAELLKHI